MLFVDVQAPPLPSGTNAGINDAVLNLDFRGGKTLATNLAIIMGVNPCTKRRASGCAKINLDSVELCAPGQVEMRSYEPETSYWRPLNAVPFRPSNSTPECECEDFSLKEGKCHQLDGLLVEEPEAHQWVMVATKPTCCIYDNTAKSCSSPTCMPNGKSSTQSHGFLGQGTVTRMPKLKPSRRPTFSNSSWSVMKMQLDQVNCHGLLCLEFRVRI